MPTIKHARISKALVDKLETGEMIRDTDLVGFGARRQNGAAVTYFLQKRIGKRVRWITIGRHGSPWTPETARKEAYRLMGQVADGVAPVTRRRDLADKPTVAEALTLFLTEHGTRLKPSSYEKYRYLIDAFLKPELGDRLVVAVGRPDVLKLHARMADRPPLANYAVSVLSKFLSWAEEHGLRPPQSNPCYRHKKFRENKRQRFLSQAEFARLGAALDHTAGIDRENYYIVAAIRLLLLTGARVGEILSLLWSSVDLERQLLLLPDSKTGQKVIRLNSHATAVLRAIPKIDGNPYVIAGRRDGAHLVNLQKPFRRIRAEAGLPDVRLHDLRHSFASVAAAQKGSLPMIGRLLGHSHIRTTQRYAHLTDDPVDSLNEDVGTRIADALRRKVASDASDTTA